MTAGSPGWVTGLPGPPAAWRTGAPRAARSARTRLRVAILTRVSAPRRPHARRAWGGQRGLGGVCEGANPGRGRVRQRCRAHRCAAAGCAAVWRPGGCTSDRGGGAGGRRQAAQADSSSARTGGGLGGTIGRGVDGRPSASRIALMVSGSSISAIARSGSPQSQTIPRTPYTRNRSWSQPSRRPFLVRPNPWGVRQAGTICLRQAWLAARTFCSGGGDCQGPLPLSPASRTGRPSRPSYPLRARLVLGL